MMRSSYPGPLLALGLWAGAAYGASPLPPVDVSFEPLLTPPWLVHVRGGGIYAQSVDNLEPLKLREPGEGGVIRSLAAGASGGSAVVAWIDKKNEVNRLQAVALSPEGQHATPTDFASGISSSLVNVITSTRGPTYILDASTGDNATLYITAWNGPSTQIERVKLDTTGVMPIKLLSAIIIQNHFFLFVSSGEDERAVIRAIVYRLPFFERESIADVAESDSVVFLKSLAVNNLPALVYKHQRGGVFGVSLAAKTDTGYSSTPIHDIANLDVARTAENTWADGSVLILLSGEDRGRFKQRVYAAVSPDGGKTWRMRRIDTPQGASTRAWLPDLAAAGDQVAAVWEDFRNIRPEVRMQLSSDRGQNWLNNDFVVSDGRHYAIRPRIRAHEGKLYIAWYQYRTDARKEADAMLTRLNWEDAFSKAHQNDTRSSMEEREQLLKKAVADYWDAMMQGDFRRAYGHYDPFYRARTSLDAYAAQRGRFIYHSSEIRAIEIDGNVARVQSVTNFEVPKIMIMGREQSIEPRDFPIDDTWLYIDGSWFRQYIDGLTGGSAVRY